MESKVFSLELDEKLIDFVRDNPILYDMTRKDYKDPLAKFHVWKEIADSLNLDVHQCQIRWKTIRDTHRRSLNRLKNKAATVPAPSPKSRYSNKALQFLDTILMYRPIVITATIEEPKLMIEEVQPSSSKINSVFESQVCEVSLSKTEVDDDLSLVEESDDNYSSVVNDDEERRPVRLRKNIKSSRKRPIEEVKSGNEERNVVFNDLVESRKTRLQNPIKEHPVNMFFSSMAEVVKTFPPHLIAEARMKVCQVVNEIECRALQHAWCK